MMAGGETQISYQKNAENMFILFSDDSQDAFHSQTSNRRASRCAVCSANSELKLLHC